MTCGVRRRCNSDPVLLWLWGRLAATAPIRPLAWESPCAMRVALEKAKRQEKKKKGTVPVKYHLVIIMLKCLTLFPLQDISVVFQKLGTCSALI